MDSNKSRDCQSQFALGRVGSRVAEVNINTRVFLVCFMAKFFPDNMFPNANEPNALALREASENVLKHWYEIIDALT